MVSAPYVERFGPQHRTPRGSIVVCLYGKPEFFFVQNCLYSGLPGIEDYEFIYVSNSPEMAETLLREAHCASLIYGLTISIVILPAMPASARPTMSPLASPAATGCWW